MKDLGIWYDEKGIIICGYTIDRSLISSFDTSTNGKTDRLSALYDRLGMKPHFGQLVSMNCEW